MAHLCLLVLRCIDIEKSRLFYQKLGLTFVAEQHGKGSKHYAATLETLVLELYPLKEGEKIDNCRLGFVVFDIEKIIAEEKTIVFSKPKKIGKVLQAVLTDPDGRKIEIRQEL